MPDLYQINQERSIPIYQQLVDVIRANIKSGKMAPGMQLPTVRELAQRLGVAQGTVKRSYDELEQQTLTPENLAAVMEELGF